MRNLVLCLTLAAVAAADRGVAPSTTALRGPSPLTWDDEGEEVPWTGGSDESEGQLNSPRKLTRASDYDPRTYFYAMPVFGCIIWCFLPWLIWNNERLAVKHEEFIKKAKDHCVIIDDINVEPPEILVDHVVFVTGITSQKETLVDPYFPVIKAENAVRLRRRVEMYQLLSIDDGKKTFGWAEQKIVNSTTNFDYCNPEMPFPSSSRVNCLQAPAGSVKMGVFYCGAFVRRDMKNWETLNPSTIIDKLKSCAALSPYQAAIKDECIYFGEGAVNPAVPQVGNFRVFFEVLNCGPLAALGVLEKKDGWSFLPLIQEHCTHSHALCDDITCKQRQNLHWTGRKEDLPSLKAAVEKIETELTSADRSALDAKLLTQQTDDFDAVNIAKGQQMNSLMKWFGSVLGHEDFIPLAEKSVGYEAFISTTASDARSKTCRNRFNFLVSGVCGVFFILAPIFWLLSWQVCMPFSFICYWPGAYFFLILCAGGCVCSSSCTALIMGISVIRFRPLMSILLFSWFAVAVVTLQRMQGPGDNS